MSVFFEFDKWKKEIKKGLIEMCILALLKNKRMYGYEISKALSRISKGILSIDDGTLYPLLRRLESKKLILGEWSFIQGKARKYYRLQSLGIEVLKDMEDFWIQITESVNLILQGDVNV